jgi:protein-tyrosine phosphatase
MDLQRRGERIVLAHPERCQAFHRDRGVLESLVRAGVLTSITAGSLVGRFGEQVRRFSRGLVRDGMVHNVASDAHDHVHRPPGVAVELERGGLAPLADWLTVQVPSAILEDADIPPTPMEVIADIESAWRPWWRRRP